MRIELFSDNRGETRVLIRAGGNHEALFVSSESYKDDEAALHAVELLKRDLNGAELVMNTISSSKAENPIIKGE